jgi:hypothetical protein
VGAVLLWTSGHWSLRDKLLGTLVWPGGLFAPVVVFFILGSAGLVATASQCTGGHFITGQPTTPGYFVNGPSTAQGFIPPHCATTTFLPPWLLITLGTIILVVSLAGPIVVAIRLLRARKPEPVNDGVGPELVFQP